ncbi:hypothetical protein J6590_043526 [Homalodisca vitripennis]|nr:hypothetical protein J6590_043526 [Homalodisca vitripennis]
MNILYRLDGSKSQYCQRPKLESYLYGRRKRQPDRADSIWTIADWQLLIRIYRDVGSSLTCIMQQCVISYLGVILARGRELFVVGGDVQDPLS